MWLRRSALEALRADGAAEVTVQLARLFAEPDMASRALRYLLEAGANALRPSANAEAFAHFGRCLELVQELPESVERDRRVKVKDLGDSHLTPTGPHDRRRGSPHAPRLPVHDRAGRGGRASCGHEGRGTSPGLARGAAGPTAGRAGEAQRGLDVVREAKALAESTDAHRFEAELERLDGELTLLLGGDCAESVAEAFLRRALEVARQQEARGWELRVATSLARLW